MQLIARSTVEGNEAILNLSIQSVKESKSTKVITIMALIYVPASFAAVSSIFVSLRSLGQNFVTVFALNSVLEMTVVIALFTQSVAERLFSQPRMVIHISTPAKLGLSMEH